MATVVVPAFDFIVIVVAAIGVLAFSLMLIEKVWERYNLFKFNLEQVLALDEFEEEDRR